MFHRCTLHAWGRHGIGQIQRQLAGRKDYARQDIFINKDVRDDQANAHGLLLFVFVQKA